MDPSGRWQSIAPAPDEPAQCRPVSDKRKRRQAIAVACTQCRERKAKCDGTRPWCNRCRDRNLTCQYDVAEGVSRAERIKIIERDSVNGELEDLRRIVTLLRSGADDQAAALLARLRLGELPKNVFSLVDTSRSRTSHELTFDQGESTKVSQDSAIFLNSPTSKAADWSPSASPPSCSTPLGKRKQSTIGDAATDQTFLVPLFDRDNFLLAKNKPEDESEGEEDFEKIRIDPRQTSNSDIRTNLLLLSERSSQSQRPSLYRRHIIRSIYPTQLTDRQSIAHKAHIHPDFNIGNLFGNMPFSRSIRNNHYPADIQDTQINNFFLPVWAMLPINTVSGPGSLGFAFSSILQEAGSLKNMGVSIEQIIETHPNFAALFNEDVFRNSGILSKWAAGMVHGMFLKGDTFSCFGYMYVFWCLMRWMIIPSPETYNAIPEWLRPSPNQLFMPHISIVDFVVWPAFRELAVQVPAMQERMWWLIDMSMNIECDWSYATWEALCKSKRTGQADLCDAARHVVKDLANWSVGPSFRGYVSNADSYVRIRTEGH